MPLILLVGVAVMVAGAAISWKQAVLGLPYYSILVIGLCSTLSERRKQRKAAGVIAQAVARIAERVPRPEWGRLAPELQAVAADRFQHDPETRRLTREAAQRIDSMAASLKDLPLPATAPAPDPRVLPRPAGAPAPDTRALPRVPAQGKEGR